MPDSNRRDFLLRGSGWAALAAAPAWLRDALPFVQDPQGLQDPKRKTLHDRMREKLAKQDAERVKMRRPHLENAVELAKRQGKPLLVFVLPERGAQDGDVLGGAIVFSALLNKSNCEERCDLALCVPVCARVSELHAIVGLQDVKQQPSLLLVDVAGDKPLRQTPVRLTPEPYPERSVPTTREQRQAEIAWVVGSVRRLGAALHTAIERHASRAQLAKDVVAKLSPAEVVALDAWIEGGKAPKGALLVQAAAIITQRVTSLEPKIQQHRLRSLAAAYEVCVVRERVFGSRWMRYDPCGARPERKLAGDASGPMMQCGMAALPPVSQRFLKFYL